MSKKQLWIDMTDHQLQRLLKKAEKRGYQRGWRARNKGHSRFLKEIKTQLLARRGTPDKISSSL